MAKTELKSTATPAAAAPLDRLQRAFANHDEVVPQIGGSVNSVRAEVDDAYADMKTFFQREPDEIMRMTAGHSARLSELRVKIMRVEDFRSEWRQVRQRDIEPTLEELQRQFSTASRLQSVRELDWRMEANER